MEAAVMMHEASSVQGMSVATPVVATQHAGHNAARQLPTPTPPPTPATPTSQLDVPKEMIHASRGSLQQTMDISFENITYNVSMGFRKGTKEILRNIHGRLSASQLIALMGPSGAGKSSLLDVLSGFKVTGVDGNIYVNGRARHLDSFRRCSAYITQEDRLEPLLTVIESMRVAADLKLPTSTPRYEKESIIEEILTTLGLYEHMRTQAGMLSGGQKKRLSIALELVNNPMVIFLDEPTTGLDSSSCTQVVNLLKVLARQGRTVICTIHQPSAWIFQLFDQVYLLSNGECLYQGATAQLIPFLESIKLPCPIYHNPADYVIELACGEYGQDKIEALTTASQNGRNLQWFTDPHALKDLKSLRAMYPLEKSSRFTKKVKHQATPLYNQLKVLLRRGFIMACRDSTLTYLRIVANIFVGIMLGTVFLQAGNDGSRVLDNYNLLFSVEVHLLMTTMMLTIVTFPLQMSILVKEHFNRWYSLKAFYISTTLIDIPISVICCTSFSMIVYFMSAQPMEFVRFVMFFVINLLVMSISQGVGLMIGAVSNVVNGCFIGPVLSVPLMMFSGFGVSLRDMPHYLKWGSHLSFLRYGLEGVVGAIYGLNRETLRCQEVGEIYCHYRYPTKFLSDVALQGDQFWNDVIALSTTLLLTRIAAFLLLKYKIVSMR